MKLINKILVGIATLGILTGCENLDQEPYNALPLKGTFRDFNDATALHNVFYSSLRGTYSGMEKRTDIQSDLLNASIGWGNRDGQFHVWNFESGATDVASAWKARYSNIADINICIENFPKIPIHNATEQAKINVYLGEAYALRAYYYLQLVQRFCVNYNDNTKNTPELGLPLVLKYDITAMPSRSTLEETYNQIFSDIARAKTLLATEAGRVGSLYLTIDAVKAIEAKALLAKQDYAQAYTVAASLVDSNRYPLTNDVNTLKKMWYQDASNETILQLFTSADELSGNFDHFLHYDEQKRVYAPDYIPSQWVINLYEDTDIRKGVYFEERPTLFNARSYRTKLVVKYPRGLYTKTSYAHAPKILRIAEQYLIAAEAAYKAGNENNAKNYLNALRTARGVANVTSTGADLFTDIKNERLRELAFEGFRLDDLKRWGDEVKRHDPQQLEYLMVSPPENFYTLQKPATDYRFVWPIPEYDRQINKNLKQNPGY